MPQCPPNGGRTAGGTLLTSPSPSARRRGRGCRAPMGGGRLKASQGSHLRGEWLPSPRSGVPARLHSNPSPALCSNHIGPAPERGVRGHLHSAASLLRQSGGIPRVLERRFPSPALAWTCSHTARGRGQGHRRELMGANLPSHWWADSPSPLPIELEALVTLAAACPSPVGRGSRLACAGRRWLARLREGKPSLHRGSAENASKAGVS